MEVKGESNTVNDNEKLSRHGQTSHGKSEKHFNIRTTLEARPENSTPHSSVGTLLPTVQDETLSKLRPTKIHKSSASVPQSKNSLLNAV
jgi:hypothetical protein